MCHLVAVVDLSLKALFVSYEWTAPGAFICFPHAVQSVASFVDLILEPILLGAEGSQACSNY